jgi:hypothetical protein
VPGTFDVARRAVHNQALVAVRLLRVIAAGIAFDIENSSSVGFANRLQHASPSWTMQPEAASSSEQPQEECSWCKFMKGGPCKAVFEVRGQAAAAPGVASY